MIGGAPSFGKGIEVTRQTNLHRPIWILVAALATWLSALAVAAVAVVSMAVGRGTFALGVGAMLLVYAALVAVIGWLLVRRVSWADGLLVASGVLHLVVVISLVSSGGPAWILAFAAVAVLAVVAAMLPVSRAWISARQGG